MKKDCPSCRRTITGENEYHVIRELLQHMVNTPDSDHIKALSGELEMFDPIFTFAATVAQDDSGIRAAIYDTCADLSTWMNTVWIYSVSHASVALDAMTHRLLMCEKKSGVIEINQANRLRDNLNESLIVAKRSWR